MAGPECIFCTRLKSLGKEAGTDLVWEFPNSVAYLGLWQFYRGYCVLVARRHATELSQLDDDERRAYLEEMCLLARAIEDCFRPHKLNYELLGNQMPHLHWHLFPRYAHDPAVLQPVWLALDQAKNNPDLEEQLRAGPSSPAETLKVLRQRLQGL